MILESALALFCAYLIFRMETTERHYVEIKKDILDIKIELGMSYKAKDM
jgi:hypothetical protein